MDKKIDNGIIMFSQFCTLGCVLGALWITLVLWFEGVNACSCQMVTCPAGGSIAIFFLVLGWLYCKLPAFVVWRNL